VRLALHFINAFVNADTARTPVKGWLQGATLLAGKGRIALFGEAAMFSVQFSGPKRLPMGMNLRRRLKIISS